MTLTVHGATLVIYLAANGFMTYTMYCAMKIFFDQPSSKREWVIFSCVMYWLGISTVYLLFNQPALTFGANVVFMGFVVYTYKGSWQRRIAAIVFVFGLSLLCEGVVLLFLNACGAGRFENFTEQYFCLAQLSARLLDYLVVRAIARFKMA